MRVCNTLTVEEMLARLQDVLDNIRDEGLTPEPEYSLIQIADRAGIPLYQLRYLRRRALLRSSEAQDPFRYTPGEKHRVRVRISDLMEYMREEASRTCRRSC